MDDFLTFEVRGAIIDHLNEFPSQEVCGVVVVNDDGYAYERCDNLAKNPGDEVEFNARDSLRIMDPNSNVVAYVHTHPYGPPWPSVHDQETVLEVKKPAVIASRDHSTGILEIFTYGEHLLDLPLEGRKFRHAVTDCWEAIRAWKWQNEGEKLDPFPREAYWWAEGTDDKGHIDLTAVEANADMYEKNFRSQGYEEFTPVMDNPNNPLHPRRGDVILMQLDAPVINHAAVYIGDNQIYHHRMNKKSGTNALGYLIDNGYCRKWLRRVEAVNE